MRRSLQAVLIVIGAVMIVAGSSTVLGGAKLIAGVETVTADVDNEMRFYAVWYVAAGLLLLRAVSRVTSEAAIIRFIAVAFFAAGCARILSWIATGRPHPIAITLLVIELVIPAVIIPWQAAVGKRAPT